MRSRERLIEVLDSVNAVCPAEKLACRCMAQILHHSLTDISVINIFMNDPHPNDSPHIRELLQEGLQILATEKLTGCGS